jgi:hypothetical protein
MIGEKQPSAGTEHKRGSRLVSWPLKSKEPGNPDQKEESRTKNETN